MLTLQKRIDDATWLREGTQVVGFKRKVAIVTGASGGIGRAVSLALANQGCNVAVSYATNAQAGNETAELCGAAGAETRVVQADVSSDEDCRALVARAAEAWGRVDVLINNAGTTRFVSSDDLDGLSASDFERLFAVNVTGAYQMARAASSYLGSCGNPTGSIVNVSSHAGLSGIGSSIAYAASKGALNTLTLGLARALAPAIRVNAVCPGLVDTDWLAPTYDAEELAALKAKSATVAPLGRIVSADEVAEAVCWFALGGASTTGQLLVIDGGTHLTVGTPL